MRNQTSKPQITNRDILLYAVSKAGGDVDYVTTEDVGVLVFKLYPQRFGLIKYPQYPDLDSVQVTLFDLRKPKYGSLIEGSQRRGWRLTEAGGKWLKTNSESIQAGIKNKLSGERRISGGHMMTTEKVRSARLARVLKSEAFLRWRQGKKPSVYDFFDVMRVDNYTPENVYREHLQALLEVISDKSDAKEFLTYLARTYGGNYRSH